MFGKDFLQGTIDDLDEMGVQHPSQIDGPLRTDTTNPDEFGMPGRKPMTQPTRMAGVKLGSAGLANAALGKVVEDYVMPYADKVIGMGVNHIADTLRNPSKNQTTASLLGLLGARF